MKTVNIALPTWLRVYTSVFGLVWCGMLLVFVVVLLTPDLSGTGPAVVMPLLMLGFGGTIIFRQLRLCAVSDGDALVVRNFIRTTRFEREEIAEFRTARGVIPIGRTIVVVPKHGDLLNIDATMQMPALGRDRHPDQLGELRAWIAEGNTLEQLGPETSKP